MLQKSDSFYFQGILVSLMPPNVVCMVEETLTEAKNRVPWSGCITGSNMPAVSAI